MAQYPLPQSYSCLSLPQLGLRAESHIPVTLGDPIRAPKQPNKDTPKTSVFVCQFIQDGEA